MGWLLPLLPILGPPLLDGLKGIFNGISRRIVGDLGIRPQNAGEYIAMNESDTKKLQALAELDKPVGNIAPWVANLRASFRYLAAGAVIIICGIILIASTFAKIEDGNVEMAAQMMFSVFNFLFADRLYVHLKRSR